MSKLINKTFTFLFSVWGVNYTHPKYDHYVDFVNTVANISYHSLNAFNKFKNDAELNSVNMMNLVIRVKYVFNNYSLTNYVLI